MPKPRYELKRIGIFSAAKTLFVIWGTAGFVLGLLQWAFFSFTFWALENAPVDTLAPYGLETELLAGSLGGLTGIIFPIIGGMLGSVAGVCAALILGNMYNLAARIWGGLELEWSEVLPAASHPVIPVPSTPPGTATPLPGVAPAPTSPESPKQSDDDNTPPRRPSSSMYE